MIWQEVEDRVEPERGFVPSEVAGEFFLQQQQS